VQSVVSLVSLKRARQPVYRQFRQMAVDQNLIFYHRGGVAGVRSQRIHSATRNYRNAITFPEKLVAAFYTHQLFPHTNKSIYKIHQTHKTYS
jgi:hypothetical protein